MRRTPATGTRSVLLDLVGRPQRRRDGAAWASVRVPVPPAVSSSVLAAAKRCSIDETTTWLAAWAVVLDKLAGEPDVVVARVDVNATSSIAITVDPHASVQDLLRAVGHAAPVSDEAESAWAAPDLEPSGTSAGPMLVWQLVTIASGHELVARFGPVLEEATVRDLAARLLVMVERLVASLDRRVEEIRFLDPAEEQQVLVGWNQTEVRYRPGASVHALFRERAAERPDAVALFWDGGRMTYRELDRRSDALARRLVGAGVVRGACVGVALDRSPEAIVTILAILKAGGAYVPLDPSYPAVRLAFLISDAELKVIVARAEDRARLPVTAGVSIVDVEGADEAANPLADDLDGSALAYVLYTSGSTGTPKGVQIEHGSIIRLVGRVDYVRLATDTVMLHAAPLGFDASTLEVWGPLLNGGAIAIHSERVPTGRGLARTISGHGVTTAWLTAALFNAVVDEDPRLLSGLRQLYTGGEALSVSHVRRALASLPATELVNGYGPTECTTFTTTHSIPRDLPAEASSVPIGRPIADTRVYVLNRRREPVPIGVAGELWVGGAGVARGYLRRPELDAERFAPDPFLAGGGLLYRTGDLVRWLPDATIEFIGRIDQQVKIRGFRIELGEIEAALARQAGVRACAVAVHDLPSGDGKRLVAYVVPDSGKVDSAALRAALARELPEFMVPSAFVELAALPVTDNGKLDRRALPVPDNTRPELSTPYRAPVGPVETALCDVFAEMLGVDRVGSLDNFFELGGNSLLATRTLARLRAAGLPEISAVQFFTAPNAAGLAQAIAGAPSNDARTRRRAAPRSETDPIAIVGMAVRLPGARDVGELWANLCAGRESITHFAPEDLDPSLPSSLTNDPSYVRARGVLDDVEMFDAGFFGMTPIEAQITDPQQRLFLETVWEALEHSGYVPERTNGRVGVFAGMYNATYYQRHVVHRADLIGRAGELNVMLGNEKDYLTSRVAHRIGLTGPAVTVQTACSTSLVAVCQAVESLRRGACEMAIAGGAAVTCPPKSGYLNEEGTMTSPDGRTRTFDAKAAGTLFSDGVAAVVLKRLADAVEDGDRIYAVIRGGAVNNDGAARASFTAPSPEGQAAVIAAALENAGVDARSIGYVEAHGTATPIGDPIEIEGLTRAFRRTTSDSGFCAIGSLKSNIGHTTIAAGAAGLIKATLALSERVIPPTIHFEAPNPKIDFERTPFVVCSRLTPWEKGVEGVPRRAGVSSFGFGGTNAHVVLEEAPSPVSSSSSTRPQQLVLLSAQSEAALADASKRLASYLTSHPDVALADVAHTLRVGRRDFAHRRFVVASSAADAAQKLAGESGARKLGDDLPELGILFPGQGSQYSRMAQGLYESEPVFRAAYDECCRILAPHFDGDAKARFFSDDPGALTQTSITQPAVFSLEYSLARLLLHVGLRPSVLIGHSVGEFVAAVLAEVMPLDRALTLVAHRGRLMQALPSGSMLSVRLPAAQLEARLPSNVSLAAENGPTACVAAGPTDAIDALARALEADEIPAKRLVTSHAFHSAMMDPILDTFAKLVAEVPLAAPRIPIVSTVTGTWLTPEEATSARYWTEHLRRPVRFSPAVSCALADPRRVLVEAGPRATLSTLARQHVESRRALPAAIPTLTDSPESEPHAFASALGRLWQLGVSLDWDAYVAGERRARVPLPTYPFQRKRHWIDATAVGQPAQPIQPVATNAAPSPTAALAYDLITQQLEIMTQQLAALTPATGNAKPD